MLYAHYYATKANKVLFLTKDIQGIVIVKKFTVTGKIEARKIASANGAKAWNF